MVSKRLNRVPTTVGGNIREYRRLRNLTISDLARLSGVHKSSISRAETDDAIPSPQSLLRLAYALRCTVADLTSIDQGRADLSQSGLIVAPGPELQDIYSEDLKRMSAELYFSWSTAPNAGIYAGDLLFVSAVTEPEDRDLILIGSEDRSTIVRYHAPREPVITVVSPMVYYEHVAGDVAITYNSAERVFGVIIEVRTPRVMLQRGPYPF